MKKQIKRGFVTVATGKYYCWLAENLLISYRLFCDHRYPFYLITDEEGKGFLKETFDGIIVMKDSKRNYLDKLHIYDNTPFEETIFIDADCHIVSDISYLFDEFENNGADISTIGKLHKITPETPPYNYGMAAVEHFGIKEYMAFNGGIYYFKQSERASQCLDFIFNDIIPNYEKYDLLVKKYLISSTNKGWGDEPIFGVATRVFDFPPLWIEGRDVLKYFGMQMEKLHWDMDKKVCTAMWRGEKVSPEIIHYATYNTRTLEYINWNIKLRGRYKKTWKPIVRIKIIFADIAWAFKPKQLKAFFKWVGAHFTISHFKYRCGQIKRLFTKKRGK